jgi:hypothetical protein
MCIVHISGASSFAVAEPRRAYAVSTFLPVEAIMSIKEFLQLLAMMIPTLIVLGAAAFTLAFSPGGPDEYGAPPQVIEDVLRHLQTVAGETGSGYLYTSAVE